MIGFLKVLLPIRIIFWHHSSKNFHPCLLHADAKKPIMQEGQAGLFMYVVLKGSVVIFLAGTPVEKVGPGGVFGELALIDQQPRAASAVAEADCSLLAISRKALLELIRTKPAFGKSLLAAVADRGRFMVSRLR